MIIDSTYFSSYLKASELTISRLDDRLGDFWLKDWFSDFQHRDKIFVHSFPQQEQDIEEIIKFCSKHRLPHQHSCCLKVEVNKDMLMNVGGGIFQKITIFIFQELFNKFFCSR